jgi:hypothetical protein
VLWWLDPSLTPVQIKDLLQWYKQSPATTVSYVIDGGLNEYPVVNFSRAINFLLSQMGGHYSSYVSEYVNLDENRMYDNHIPDLTGFVMNRICCGEASFDVVGSNLVRSMSFTVDQYQEPSYAGGFLVGVNAVNGPVFGASVIAGTQGLNVDCQGCRFMPNQSYSVATSGVGVARVLYADESTNVLAYGTSGNIDMVSCHIVDRNNFTNRPAHVIFNVELNGVQMYAVDTDDLSYEEDVTVSSGKISLVGAVTCDSTNNSYCSYLEEQCWGGLEPN